MLCPAKDSFAQERNYDFNLVSSTDNIPLGKIKAIAQDAKGYLWLGDEGYGLIRYDGYKMIRYKFQFIRHKFIGPHSNGNGLL
jgi:ligand-binding sensor domain-containing protein